MFLFRHGRLFVRRLHVKKDYVIVKATKKDVPAIEKFAEEQFFKNDPCCIMTNVASKPRPSAVLIDDLTENIPHGLSLLAKYNEADPRILGIGISLIRPAQYPVGYLDNKMKELIDPKERKLMEFWAHIGVEPRNLPKSYYEDSKNIVEFRYLAVHQSHQRKGIARALMEGAREEAMNSGLKFFRCECTSAYTSRLCSEYGMKMVYQLRYEDYKDSEGNYIFKDQVAAPHTSIWIYLGKFE